MSTPKPQVATEQEYCAARRTVQQVGRAAAVLFNIVVVGNEAQRRRVAWHEQQLTTDAVALATIQLAAVLEIFEVAFALVVRT